MDEGISLIYRLVGLLALYILPFLGILLVYWLTKHLSLDSIFTQYLTVFMARISITGWVASTAALGLGWSDEINFIRDMFQSFTEPGMKMAVSLGFLREGVNAGTYPVEMIIFAAISNLLLLLAVLKLMDFMFGKLFGPAPRTSR